MCVLCVRLRKCVLHEGVGVILSRGCCANFWRAFTRSRMSVAWHKFYGATIYESGCDCLHDRKQERDNLRGSKK